MSIALPTRRIAALSNAFRALNDATARSTFPQRIGDPTICDFYTGNPQEGPLPEYVEALQKALVPQHPHWFAYQESEPRAQEVVAASLSARLGLPFEPADIAMTTAGYGALLVALTAVIDSGDEVIFSLPPWFVSEFMTIAVGGVPVKVNVDARTWNLDLDAIAAAITPRTRVVMVNTPSNPTGKIYSPETLTRLGLLLDEASARNGRTIYLLSDEAYNRIIFSESTFHTPLEYYPNAMLAYSYGKTLLSPGQRIGYLALPPTMPDRAQLRESIAIAQYANTYAFPNRLLQHAIPEIDPLVIDVPRIQRKRDQMVSALRELGYEVHIPEGTFYLFPKSPWADDVAFSLLLEQHDIFTIPGAAFEWPGYFRISLTATEEMIERSLPGFAAAIAHARAHEPAEPALATVAADD